MFCEQNGLSLSDPTQILCPQLPKYIVACLFYFFGSDVMRYITAPVMSTIFKFSRIECRNMKLKYV